MRFFLYLVETFSWKNLVFLSPYCIQLILDLCLHISSSLAIQQFNSILVFLKDIVMSRVEGYSSNHSNLFCNSATVFPKFSNSTPFHISSLARQLSKQLFTTSPDSPYNPHPKLLHILDPLTTSIQIGKPYPSSFFLVL